MSNKIKIPRFHEFRQKLMMILRNNPNINELIFDGFLVDNALGIRVRGSDVNSVSNFERFYTLQTINHFFSRLDKTHSRR